jgi:hypothetical protein
MQTLYKITCTANNRVYVGKTKKKVPKYRWAQHRYELERGIHPNVRMLEDFVQFGIKAFEFQIIRKVRNTEVTYWEQKLIWELNAYYNIRLNRKDFKCLGTG